jgi:hypothetical protein
LQAAQTKCNEESSCAVLFDYGCDGERWRWCASVGLTDLKASGTDTGGCTMAKAYQAADETTNSAYAVCSTWHGTKYEAQARCNAEPSCTMLHYFMCDDTYWRYCKKSLDRIERAGDDRLGCALTTKHATALIDGPKVSNRASSFCSDWKGTLAEAHLRCSVESDCKALYDYDCDGQMWRTCTHTTGMLQTVGSEVDACTKTYTQV